MCVWVYGRCAVGVSITGREESGKRRAQRYRWADCLRISFLWRLHFSPSDFKRNWIHYDCLSDHSFSSKVSFHLSYPRLSEIKGGQEEIQRCAEREDKRSHLQSYIHVSNKSWRISLGSWRNLTLKDAPGLETPLKPRLLQINLHCRKTEMCLTLKYEMEEMEKLKAPLRDCSLYYSNPPNRHKRKSWEVSHILIRRDQSALYTTAAKCSLIPWHFWVREHFTVVFLYARKKRDCSETERSNIRRGLARPLRVINKCACTPAQPPLSAFLSICVSRIAWVPVSFPLLWKPFRHLSFSLLQFSLLIGPRCPYGNDVESWVR